MTRPQEHAGHTHAAAVLRTKCGCSDCHEVASKLPRLLAENARLAEALRRIVQHSIKGELDIYHSPASDIEAARALLAERAEREAKP